MGLDIRKCTSLFVIPAIVAVLAVGSLAVSARAQGSTPPDLTICEGVTACEAPKSVCSDAGFTIKLTNYTPATAANSGSASYTYEICSPLAGVCDGTVRNGESCLDNSFCQKKGMQEDLNAKCSRECATDSFRGLFAFHHFNPHRRQVHTCQRP